MMRGFRVPAGLLVVAVAAATILQYLAVPQASWAQAASPEDAAIVRHLNAAITWYKQLTRANESAGQPSDAFYLENVRPLAKKALQLAFQSAETEAALLLTENGGKAAGAGLDVSSQTSGQQQNIAKSAAQEAAQVSQIQTQIETLTSQIPKVSGKERQELISKRDSLQEQLDFVKALQEPVQKLSTFMNGSARKVGGLQEEVDNLKKSVPALFAEAPEKEAVPAPSSPPPNSSEGSGLISQASNVFSRSGDLREINQLIEGASTVSEMARQVQSPLRARLRATIEQGRGLAYQPTPQDPASMEATRQKMTSLAMQFKQISAATIPLAQEIILLDESQASLRQWEDSAHKGILGSFLIQVAFLLMGIVVVVAISELWRRATFRYVHEARMRHQLLLLRHIITGLLLALVLALGLVSKFSSLATFAGFVAAGIAVALQTLIGVAEAPDVIEDYRLCPKCRSTVYGRSRRRWYERLLKRPRMARCMRCDHRFPYPQ